MDVESVGCCVLVKSWSSIVVDSILLTAELKRHAQCMMTEDYEHTKHVSPLVVTVSVVIRVTMGDEDITLIIVLLVATPSTVSIG